MAWDICIYNLMLKFPLSFRSNEKINESVIYRPTLQDITHGELWLLAATLICCCWWHIAVCLNRRPHILLLFVFCFVLFLEEKTTNTRIYGTMIDDRKSYRNIRYLPIVFGKLWKRKEKGPGARATKTTSSGWLYRSHYNNDCYSTCVPYIFILFYFIFFFKYLHFT